MAASWEHSLGLSIPFFNEEACCEEVVTAVHTALSAVHPEFHLALVDNGSTDRTGAILRELEERFQQCTVVHLAENAGYGGGIRAGLQRLDTQILGWHWGDGQISPETIVSAWKLMIRRPFQVVKASRTRRLDGTNRARISAIYAQACQQVLGLESPDINGCPKLLRRELLEQLDLRSSDWLLDLEAIYKIEALNLRIGCVDAVMHARRTGKSNVAWSTIREFTLAIARTRLNSPPWK